MAETILRGKDRMIIGYIEETPSQLIARDKHYRLVGYYRPGDNYTRDHQQMILGGGKSLSA